MADGTTPNLGLVKPEVGASDDTWGDKTNSNWDKVDSLVATKAENDLKANVTYVDAEDAALQAEINAKADAAATTAALALKAPLDSPPFTGNPTAPTAPDRDKDTSVANTNFVQRAVGLMQEDSISASTFTLTAEHMGKTLWVNQACVITYPANTLEPRSRIDIISNTTGAVTLAASGTNLSSKNGFKTLSGQFSAATLIVSGDTNFAVLIGDLMQ